MREIKVAALLFCTAISSTNAQTMSSRISAVAEQPTATVSFKPILGYGSLNGSLLMVSLYNVSVLRPSGPVNLRSAVQADVSFVESPQPIPNGFYSVQYHFTYSSGTVIRITRNNKDTLAECPIPADTLWTVEKPCDSGIFEVTDGQLRLTAQAISGNDAYLQRITVNTYPPPTTLKSRE